jgi:ABC-2 type transport system ATP-binding protein
VRRVVAEDGLRQAAIAVDRLRIVRGPNVVIPEITFGVRPGTVTGLLGPSGSGKTTLMRAIVGVQRIAGGRVTVLGHPAGSPVLRSRVGYVTQAPAVYGDLTVTENLNYFARILGADGVSVEDAIRAVDLERERNRVARTLSGGEVSRVSLATALLGEPEVLVLDEPTVGLDPVLRRDLWELFRRLASGGVTLIVSSHVMDEADRCDRLLLLRAGQLLADEAPAALRSQTGCDSLDQAFLTLVEGT